MKVLAFSDLHKNTGLAHEIVQASSQADILIGAGDFGVKGIGAELTLEILQSANIPLIIVSGNHDNVTQMRQLASNWNHVHFLHGDYTTIEGVSFFGLGSEIPRREKEVWSESVSEHNAAQMLNTCPEGSVLITHTPPFGFGDLQADGRHEGSKAILLTLREKRPVLNLCGHIHHSWGVSGNYGRTLIQNLGPKLYWFEIDSCLNSK